MERKESVVEPSEKSDVNVNDRSRYADKVARENEGVVNGAPLSKKHSRRGIWAKRFNKLYLNDTHNNHV